MKKGTFIIGIMFLIIFLSGQEIQEDAIAINIEVPVRVFTKGKFVEELNLEDFEVYEDGVPQKVEALYLVKKTVIDREETELDKKSAGRIYLPEVSRTFVLAFEMMDYFPKLEETLEYFFNNVFLPDDLLYVVTPLKTLMDFRDQLKDIEGQKYVFLFYQKKVIPVPHQIPIPDDVERLWISFDVDRIKKAFSDSLISINFIFATKTDPYHMDGYRINPAEQRPDPSPNSLQLIDPSDEIFGAFHEMAKSTGGITESSANIASSFQRAVIASENYYLLYYSPKAYKADGKFRNIKVKVKSRNYRVTHRAGYIAD